MGVTFDYHPFNNGFYLSGGGFYNGNKAKFKISPREWEIDGKWTRILNR